MTASPTVGTVGTSADVVAAHDPTIRFRRVAGAIALPLAFALQLACNAVYAAISTASGLTDQGPADETFALYARYPGPLAACTLLAALGGLAAVPGLLAALRVLRPCRPRLALWAVALMVAGYVSYLGIVLTNVAALGFAAAAGPDPDGAALVLFAGVVAGHPVATPFFLVFALGNLVGTLLLGLAVILAHGLPRYAGALILGWPVGHVVNLVVGNEWFAVAGGAVEIAGLTVLAALALRTPDRRWAARG